MWNYNRYMGRAIDSSILLAAAKDSMNDVLATGAVVLSALLSPFVPFPLDGLMGVAVSCLILWTGYGVARDTIDRLLGRRPEEELRARIENLVLDNSMVLGMHDLMVHDYGPGRTIASVHAEVPDNLTLVDVHAVIDLIEHKILSELNVDIVIHMDPVATDDLLVNTTKAEIVRLLTENLAPGITIHDFRMVPGSVRTKVLFDAVIPLDVHLSDQEIILKIKNIILKKRDDLDVAVTIDRPYA